LVIQSFHASRVLLFVALGVSKCSVIVFIQGIFDYIKTVIRVSSATMVVVVIWALAGALAVSVGCSPDRIVVQQENFQCANDVSPVFGLRVYQLTIMAGSAVESPHHRRRHY
jgi:hypothetical protein